MRDAEVTLPGETSSVPTARHFAESILTAWALPEYGWTAALLVSELAANCALHARTTFTVRVEVTEETVLLSVSDGSTRTPAVRDYGSTATTGRGLRMVDQLASDWGVDLHDGGKTVWALLREVSQDTGHSDEADSETAVGAAAAGAAGGDVVRLRVPAAPVLRLSA